MNRRKFIKQLLIASAGVPLIGLWSRAMGYLYLPHRRKSFSIPSCTVSNGSFLDIACVSGADPGIDAWTDGDANGESTAVTFDTKSCWKFDGGPGSSGNFALRSRDIGSLDGVGNTIVISMNIYCDAIGAIASADDVNYSFDRSDWQFALAFGSDGVGISQGGAPIDTGVAVTQDTWQEWSFDIDLSGGVGSAVCDIYLDNVRVAAGVDCSRDTGGTDGLITLYQFGYFSADRLHYLDWLKVGNAFT